MKNIPYFMIRFFRGKEELRAELKAWCAIAKKDMNMTIIELIENHLKNNKEK